MGRSFNTTSQRSSRMQLRVQSAPEEGSKGRQPLRYGKLRISGHVGNLVRWYEKDRRPRECLEVRCPGVADTLIAWGDIATFDLVNLLIFQPYTPPRKRGERNCLVHGHGEIYANTYGTVDNRREERYNFRVESLRGTARNPGSVPRSLEHSCEPPTPRKCAQCKPATGSFACADGRRQPREWSQELSGRRRSKA